MVRQYLALKEKHKDCLLFFRLGDFYELFYEDAHLASSALDIVLTKRGKEEDAMPMCGIPFHSAEVYIGRLIRQGFKVAICEQLETPEEAKKRELQRDEQIGMRDQQMKVKVAEQQKIARDKELLPITEEEIIENTEEEKEE